jgi:riboflavin synthase
VFTGLIEEVGTIREVKRSGASSYIEVVCEKVLEDIRVGDSVAVNGVCLTATDISGDSFRADVMNETLSRSSLGALSSGSRVNLERAMSAKRRFGGHIVSGHIDGTGTVTDIKKDGIATWYTISAKPEIMRYIAEKGSIAIDGISLTVAKVTETGFSVSVIPHTADQTVLPLKKVGDTVNLENDVIAKYVERLMKPAPEEKSGGITLDFLAKNGF